MSRPCRQRSFVKGGSSLASDPAVLVETRSWLRKASEDVRAAEVARGAEPPLRDAAVFHCQQAAEKAIKGFLTLHARPFRKTHSIEEIGECVAKSPSGRNEAKSAFTSSGAFRCHSQIRDEASGGMQHAS